MDRKNRLERKMGLLRQVFAQQVQEGHWGSPVSEHLAKFAWDVMQDAAAKEGVLGQHLRQVALRHVMAAGKEIAVEEVTAEEQELAEYLSRQYPLL